MNDIPKVKNAKTKIKSEKIMGEDTKLTLEKLVAK